MKANRKFVIVSALCWLSVVPCLEAQPARPYTVSETRKQRPDGVWEVTTTVCNNTTANATVAWWSWPAKRGDTAPATRKIGTRKWYPGDTTPDPNDPTMPAGTAPGAPLNAGACVTNTETMSTEPFSSYVRINTKQPDGTWVQRILAAHDTHMAVAAALLDTNPRSEYLALPVSIPYPVDLAAMTGNQPAQFFIKSVSFPVGWAAEYVAPAFGEKVTLLPDQKEFTGIIVAKMATDLAEGEQAVVEVTWGAEAETVAGYSRTIRNLVVKDNTPPAVTLRAEKRPEGTVVTIGVRDPGGIHHPPRLSVSRTGSDSDATAEVYAAPLARVLQQDPQQEIGTTEAEFEVTVRSCAGDEMMSLQATAMDQFENWSGSLPQVFVGGGVRDIAFVGDKVKISFSGTLLEADEPAGPYVPVAGATSPYSVAPNGTKKFFRAR